MFLTYLWQARRLAHDEASAAFSGMIEGERDLYAEAWGRTPDVSQWNEGRLFLGQVRYATGVRGYDPWIDHGDCGVAWGGVCESHLGRDIDRQEVLRMIDMLSGRPEELVGWDGRFCVYAWDRKRARVVLGTAATERLTLWYAEGPRGWAVGSRARPILDLVGRARAPNMGEISLFLAYGRLVGPGCLFEGVERVANRCRMIFDGRAAPAVSTYARPLDVLRQRTGATGRSELLEVCRDRLVERVTTQHRHSESPVIHLTGGRDSRAIAAAASRTGYPGLVLSGGTPDSPTVRVAGLVADALGLERHPGWADRYIEPGTAPVYSLENLKLWTRVSEGIETIRHALTWKDFFARSLPCPPHRYEGFHGLAGEFGRAVPYKFLSARTLRKVGKSRLCRDIFRRKAQQVWVRSLPELPGRLDAVFDAFEEDVGEELSVADWLDLFFWQGYVLHSGSDQMFVMSPMRWMWTPLVDRELFRAFREVPPEEKFESRFFEALTILTAPALSGVPYDHRASPLRGIQARLRSIRKGVGQLRRAVDDRSRSSGTRRIDRHEAREELWEILFGGSAGSFWTELIDEGSLRDVIRTDPNSEALWNLATVEIFVRTNF